MAGRGVRAVSILRGNLTFPPFANGRNQLQLQTLVF